jgi:thioredoxin-like negative regulator of GroEL
VARRGGRVVRAEPVPPVRPPRRRPRPAPVEAATAALRDASPETAARPGDGGGGRAAEPPEGRATPVRPDRPRIVSRGAGARPAEPARPARRAKEPIGARLPLPARPTPIEDLRSALTRAVGARRVPRVRAELDDAAKAYDAEHFAEALRLTRKLVDLAPEVPELRELHGLTLYRLGRWREAILHLEAFRALTGTADEDHVLADCYRALKRWDDVEDLWDELRAVSPSAEVVNEGRIVVAGAHADRGDLAAGIRLLEKGWRQPARPQDHHLRRAYALADLYERSGQTVRARELFRWVLSADRDFADVAERVRTLG